MSRDRHDFLAAEGVDDWVVLHGGATAVFRVGSLSDAPRLAKAVAKAPGIAGRGVLLTLADTRVTVRLSRDIWNLEPQHVQLALRQAGEPVQPGGSGDSRELGARAKAQLPGAIQGLLHERLPAAPQLGIVGAKADRLPGGVPTQKLGARVLTLGARPDGTNINAGFGALHPETLRARVRASGAAVGFAFDGDGDRLISVDGEGEIRDGDYALAIIGRHLAERGRLKGNVLVTTVMANLGLDQALADVGITVVKTQVGDRYVHEEMQRIGANVGGEQSGHLLFLDHSPTGDGILSALALLSVVRDTGQPLASLATCMRKFPQVLVNVPVRRKPPFDTVAGVMERVAEHEREMNGAGRILLRYSGTESLARVMVEGADLARIQAMAHDLGDLIRTRLGDD